MNEIKVTTQHNWQLNTIDIWVFEFDRHTQFNLNIADGVITRTEIPELVVMNDKIKPFLQLPRFIGELILRGILDWQAQNGVKTVNQNFIEGKLDATEKHLLDLQKITTKLLKL